VPKLVWREPGKADGLRRSFEPVTAEVLDPQRRAGPGGEHQVGRSLAGELLAVLTRIVVDVERPPGRVELSDGIHPTAEVARVSR
jgi:hypothetical protein